MTPLTKKIEAVLEATQQIAPNTVEQQAFANLCEQLRMEDESELFILLSLLGAVSDGLKFGNWPSLRPKRLKGGK